MKKIIFIAIILLLVVLIRNIFISIIKLEENAKVLTNLKEEVLAQENEKKLLQERLKYVQTDEFVKEQAREKLGMVQIGETVIILSEEQKQENTTEAVKPNWEKWWDLFF